MARVIGFDLALDFDERGGLIGKLRGFDELGVDFGKIHDRKIEPLELEDGEALAGLGLGLAPGLAELGATLLLKDAADLRFKAAVDLLPGLADAEEARGTVCSDLVAQARIVLLVEQDFGRGAQAGS